MTDQPAHTFLFADLTGFTALTEAMGDEPAAELAGDFFAAVRELLPEHDAHEVKSIGDALMLRGEDPAAAILLALRIVHEVGERHGFPAVRAGLHTGPAVERDGDWFGATVNTAARVSAVASGREVVLSEDTRAAAGEVEGVYMRARGREVLRNVAEPLLLYTALREGAETEGGLPIDPVCRMAVDPGHGAGMLVHDGTEYHFCSLDCARRFAAEPERFVMD
jgi:class 3 adenylate cyclase/YHS domain-containing protein